MRKFLIIAAAAGLTFSPAHAQDDETVDDGDDAAVPALLAYLGLSAADGSNTVGEGAGAVEGHMLASAMAVKAAGEIVAQLGAPAPPSRTPVVLLADSETFSLAEYQQAEHQLRLLEDETTRFLAAVSRTSCSGPGAELAPPAAEKDRKFGFGPSDLLGGGRTSTAISPVPVSLGSQLFKNAVLAHRESFDWIVPAEIAQPGGGELFDRYWRIRTTLAPYADGKCNAVNEDIAAAAKTLLARADALAASKDGAPSMLDKAALAANVLDGGDRPKVLRVEVDKAGGTLVNSSNIWTSLGIPGITMRGGLVVTYRMLDPTSGRTEKSGIVICRMPKTLLMNLTSRDIALDEIECQTF